MPMAWPIAVTGTSIVAATSCGSIPNQTKIRPVAAICAGPSSKSCVSSKQMPGDSKNRASLAEFQLDPVVRGLVQVDRHRALAHALFDIVDRLGIGIAATQPGLDFDLDAFDFPVAIGQQ